MKNCISRVISWFIHLWHTVRSMLGKTKKHLYMKDVDQDSVPEIIVDWNGENQISDHKKEDEYDR